MNKEVILNLLDIFDNSLDAIMKSFEVPQTWHQIYPDDMTNVFWFIDGDSIVWFDTLLTKEVIDSEKYYQAVMHDNWEYKKLPSPPWRRFGLAMIPVDTHTDGNKYLMIFDEDKECKDQEVIELFREQ
jgi:hypothetical protein